jgi:hypothetical protein
MDKAGEKRKIRGIRKPDKTYAASERAKAN